MFLHLWGLVQLLFFLFLHHSEAACKSGPFLTHTLAFHTPFGTYFLLGWDICGQGTPLGSSHTGRCVLERAAVLNLQPTVLSPITFVTWCKACDLGGADPILNLFIYKRFFFFLNALPQVCVTAMFETF